MPDYAEIMRLLCYPSPPCQTLVFRVFSEDWFKVWKSPELFKAELLRLARERLSVLEKENDELEALRRAIGDSNASAS